MYDALMSSSQRIYWVNPVVDNSANGWCLSDHNFAELNKVRQQITHARFRSALDMELSKLYWDYLQAKQPKGDLEAIVSEGYNRMQRLLME